VVGEILLSLQNFKIVLRGDVAASIMTISVSEGLILQLDPDFDMVMAALPYFVRYKGWKSAEAAWKGEKE
jgi:predicted unusual protein kinase regulating ubiquinone biosynthesis (AarF/ABC1/UbiB family)